MSAEPPDQFAVTNAADLLAGASESLKTNDVERSQLRREMTGTEFRLALRNFREGLRGMIRVSPLTAVVTAALLGAVWSRRGRRRR